MASRLSSASVLAVFLLSGLGSGLGFDAAAQMPTASISLAIAPFGEKVPEGGQPLGIAERLARRLEARRLERVVVLSELGIEPLERPEARDVRVWAARAEVDSVVVGWVSEVAAEGAASRDLEISVEVRSGHSGAPLSRHHASVAAAIDEALIDEALIDEKVESLAADILQALGYDAAAAATADVAAAPPPGAESQGGILEKLGKDEPLSITSDELEVTSRGKARHLVFTHNVQVTQGDIDLQADRLEAFYPEGSSQPERLEAEGNVRVVQADRRARCERATYLQADSVVLCEGQAVLIQGCDEVRGEAIRFDVDQEKVHVIGGASVLLQPEDQDCVGETQ
ncbi:MAG: LptA/OstA family protein [Deltaproteobacteria bacterium]|nr:LptA/OstA family protein [Deltaproteobacteria bacterium]MBW2417658.1 LptA/OstA family protein [Deltaproteobacteria bacterium]